MSAIRVAIPTSSVLTGVQSGSNDPHRERQVEREVRLGDKIVVLDDRSGALKRPVD
jgi:hypothetical protein